MTTEEKNQPEMIDLTPIQKVKIVQQILQAKSLDDGVRIMNGLAANGWLTLWDNVKHPDGTSYKDLPRWQEYFKKQDASKLALVEALNSVIGQCEHARMCVNHPEAYAFFGSIQSNAEEALMAYESQVKDIN
jgi:hypothetical protein